jgi:hypothetical protein
MKRKSHPRTKHTTTKSILRLPDLEHAKTAVLNSLTSADPQRGYRHAIVHAQAGWLAAPIVEEDFNFYGPR